MVQLLRKTVWQFLKKLKIELPYEPAIPLLDIYPKELQSESQRDICILVSVITLFTTGKMWKQHKSPSIDTEVSRKLYIHTMEYYSALKSMEILTHATT